MGRLCHHVDLSERGAAHTAYEAVELRPADLVFERRVSDIEIFCFPLGIFHVRLNVTRQRSRFNMYCSVALGPSLDSR